MHFPNNCKSVHEGKKNREELGNLIINSQTSLSEMSERGSRSLAPIFAIPRGAGLLVDPMQLVVSYAEAFGSAQDMIVDAFEFKRDQSSLIHSWLMCMPVMGNPESSNTLVR